MLLIPLQFKSFRTHPDMPLIVLFSPLLRCLATRKK
jgi:hypothetical protein